ncbi:hypothetical protein niasHS_005948 [Heterodera schachtii]|uniref:RING-type domain-containing protein n=1 Tax=Heterodera schachtii TaxID=97005 RepID=A0ABD2JN07_HETSC
MDAIICLTLMLLMIAMIVQNAIALREPIKPFTLSLANNMAKYHIAQIIPPGKYKVVIWDKLTKHFRTSSMFTSRAESSTSGNSDGRIFDRHWSKSGKFVFTYDENRFNGYGQYFAHFYNIETDHTGQFLVEKNGRVADWSLFNRHYNVNITPMKGTALIRNDFKNISPWQKVYSLGIRTPVDSLCHFRQGQCLIRYFENMYDWIYYIRKLIAIYWLNEPCTGAMDNRVNFFLIGTFRYAIAEAKRAYEVDQRQQMNTEEAHLLGTFFDILTRAIKHGILLERIRLLDGQMPRLINEFCQIDVTYLLTQIDVVQELYEYETFCPRWENVYEKLTRFNEPNLSMDVFYHWIYSSNPLDDAMRETIQFWFSILSKWLNDYEYFQISHQRSDTPGRPQQRTIYSTPWLELDLDMFNRIGQLLVGAKNARLITPEKISQIPGTHSLLNKICVGTYRSQDFLHANGFNCYNIIDQWRIKLCSGGRFEYATSPRITPWTTPRVTPWITPHTTPWTTPATTNSPTPITNTPITFSPITNSPISNSPSTPRRNINSSSISLSPQNSPQLELIGATKISAEMNDYDEADKGQAENGSSSSNANCVMCLTKNRDFAFKPCFHLCGCDGCTDEVLKRDSKCPICREPTDGKVRIYQP